MQCPRCYFTNPGGTRVCEYCGARLENATESAPRAASSASKRQTQLGPLPSFARATPPRPPPVDPEDPFLTAALGASPPPSPEPPPARAPAPPPPPPHLEAQPTVRPAHRPTLVTIPQPTSTATAGVLLIAAPEAPVRAILLHEGRVRIGRRPEVEVPLDDPEASVDHAILRIDGERAWLLDTSTNGTLVDGQLCMNDRADITDGSRLQIGTTRLVVQLLRSEARDHLAERG